MKIYLAARYSRREELLSYRSDLQAMGHVVTSRWLDGDYEVDSRGLSKEASQEIREKFAREDLSDVVSATVLISFTEEPRSLPGRGGRHVEFGIALGRGHDLIVVGPRENVFHCLKRVIVFDTWESLVESRILER